MFHRVLSPAYWGEFWVESVCQIGERGTFSADTPSVAVPTTPIESIDVILADDVTTIALISCEVLVTGLTVCWLWSTLRACVKTAGILSVMFVVLAEFVSMLAGKASLGLTLATHRCRCTCAFHKRRSSSRSRSKVRTLNCNSVLEHSRAWHSCKKWYRYEYHPFTHRCFRKLGNTNTNLCVCVCVCVCGWGGGGRALVNFRYWGALNVEILPLVNFRHWNGDKSWNPPPCKLIQKLPTYNQWL